MEGPSSENYINYDLFSLGNIWDDDIYKGNSFFFVKKEEYDNLDYSLTENNENSTLTENNFEPKDDLFPYKKINNNKYLVPLFGLKKRKKPGKKKEENELLDKKPYIHTKIKFDNILNKVQISYINFLVLFVNLILKKYGREDLKFLTIDSKIKKNNKICNRKIMKEKSIGDILQNEISGKYTTYDRKINFYIYEKIKEESLTDILNVLNQKFLFFFEEVYFKNLRKFNLNQFGLMDLEVEIPQKIELFENLLMKNKKEPYSNFDRYKLKMEECIKWHFLGGLEENEEKNKNSGLNC